MFYIKLKILINIIYNIIDSAWLICINRKLELYYLILKFSTMVINKINRIIHIIPKINDFFLIMFTN